MPKGGRERRQAERHNLRLRARYWNEAIDATGFVSDVSITGLFIETSQPPPVGTRLHVELDLKQGPFLLEGLVMRRLRPPSGAAAIIQSGMGIRLVAMHEAVGIGVSSSPEHAAGAAATGAATAGAAAAAAKPAISSPEQSVATAAPVPPASPASAAAAAVLAPPSPDGGGLHAAAAAAPTEIAPAPIPGELHLDLSSVDKLRATYQSDIRHGGLFLQTQRRYETGETVSVVLNLPAPWGDLSVHGIVVNVLPAGIGVEISDISGVRQILDRVLHHITTPPTTTTVKRR